MGGPRLAAAVYLLGGVFFTTGAYLGLLVVANTRHGPARLDWIGGVTLLVGTLFFFAGLLAALIGDLTVAQEHRLVWSPEFVGCILFLVSGQTALTQLWRERGPGRHERLDWGIAAVNQLGSVLFLVAAFAAWVRPATGDELAVGVANWGTLIGALCFAVAGALQMRERPA